MSIVLTNDSNYTAIASSIRSKLGVSTTYLPSEMSGAIDSIPTGGSVYSITVTTSHCTASTSNPTSIGEGNIAELIFTPDAGYELTPPTITGASLRKRSGDRIEIENPTGNVTINIEAVQPDYFWVENVGTSNAYMSSDKKEYMYSTDKLNWTTSTSPLSPGAKIYIKGNMGKTTKVAQIPLPIGSSYSFKIGGNALTLLDYSGILEDYDNACYQMFRSCSSLVDASQLYIDKVGENMCEEMFADCSRLVTPPELPVTTLAELCYHAMFYGCTSLTTAPQLPATTLANDCYENMFNGCTSLTTAPSLPATTLASYCYGEMFAGCTSLTTAPSLPATTLYSYCYSTMFYNCTSLTTAPSLPATTLASYCYYSMFYNCTSLKVYSTSGEGHDKAWNIPDDGVFTGLTLNQSNMFKNVETDNVPADFNGTSGQQFTYYTQNQPV